MSQTVYLVHEVDWEINELVGTFASRKLAEEFARNYVKADLLQRGCCINSALEITAAIVRKTSKVL